MSDNAISVTRGGEKTGAFPAGAAETVIHTGGGRACRLVITADATTAVTEVYDSATTSTAGTLLLTTANNIAAGDIITLECPVSTGILVKGVTNSAAGTVGYNADGGSKDSPDNARLETDGGQVSTLHAAGAGGAGAALASPGRLCRVVVLSAGTAATNIYDNASAASGTKLYTVKATPTVGTIIEVNMPAANGVYVGGATNTSKLLVTTQSAARDGR